MAKDIVQKLLVLEPSQRLGALDDLTGTTGGRYVSIREHSLFEDLVFETLHQQTPPPIYPYLPGTSEHEELRSHYRVPDHLEPGLDDKQLTRLLGLEITDPEISNNGGKKTQTPIANRGQNSGVGGQAPQTNGPEFAEQLVAQKKNNPWHCFVDNNLVLKQGFVNKRKGLFARKRMLLLTTGPHLYYVDPINKVLKGEIPWSKELRVEPKNFKIFFVHTVR